MRVRKIYGWERAGLLSMAWPQETRGTWLGSLNGGRSRVLPPNLEAASGITALLRLENVANPLAAVGNLETKAWTSFSTTATPSCVRSHHLRVSPS